MEEIAISKFKATCLAVMENVRRTGRPVLVTKFGHPVVEIGPARSRTPQRRTHGAMVGTGRIVGDIVGPITVDSDWDSMR